MNFKQPWLIQRIEKLDAGLSFEVPEVAVGYYACPKDESPKEAGPYIRQILPCAYMGAAEYEFGEIPKSLKRLASMKKDLALNDFVFTGIRANNTRLGDGKESKEVLQKKLFLLSPESIAQDVFMFIQGSLKDPYSSKTRLKCRAEFREGLFGAVRIPYQQVGKGKFEIIEPQSSGWLDLDNPWIAFTSLEHCSAVMKLL